MSKFPNKWWYRIKTRGSIKVLSFFKTCWSAMVLFKPSGEDIGRWLFLLPGLSILITLVSLILAGVPIEATLLYTLLSLGLGLTSVGLGFISIGMSAKSDKRQTELLERLDKSVAGLPLLFKGDILTPSGHEAVKELRGKQSKEAAQRRLEEDTRKVGYVRGELFQNEDGSWSIHWRW